MTPVIAFGEALVDRLSSRLGDPSRGPETFTSYADGALPDRDDLERLHR